MSGSTSIDIDETTTQVPKFNIPVTTVKPADINLIPNSVVFQPNQDVALGLKTNPDDLTTTEKTDIFDGTVSQFLTLSLQTQSKELLRTFIRDI